MSALAGLRIGTSRPAGRSGQLPALLRKRGAEPVELVVTELVDPASWAPVDEAARDLRAGVYDALVLTSAAGAQRFAQRAPAPWGVPVVVVGSATAEAVVQLGVEPALVPSVFRAEGVVAAVGATFARGAKLLLPRAAEGRPALPEGLRDAGFCVNDVATHRSAAVGDPSELAAALPTLDALTVAAGSAIRHLVAAVGRQPVRGIPLVSIGPVTTAACAQLGLPVAAQARKARIEDLVDAVVAWAEERT